jgi:hypothetical protein
MTRKLALAIAAAAAIGAAALTPTAASAHMHGHHRHGGWGWGLGYVGPTLIAGPDCYVVKRQVQFADGSWHWRRFTVCN